MAKPSGRVFGWAAVAIAAAFVIAASIRLTSNRPQDVASSVELDEEADASEGLRVPLGNAVGETARDSVSGPSAATVNESAVRVLVLDPAGEPVRGASVQIAAVPDPESAADGPDWLARGETDGQGRWSAALSDPAEVIHARITAAGYLASEWQFERVDGLECRLTLAIAVRGRVLDRRTGAPLVGAIVVAQTVDRPSETTDTLGRYELTGLPAGEILSIWAVADDYAEAEHGFTTPAEGSEIEFDILLEQGVLVRGEVRDWTTGEPLADVRLRESMCERPVVTDALGQFDLRVLERRGHIALALHRAGYSSLSVKYPADQVPIERVVLRMPATLYVNGSVTTAEGEPVEDAWVYIVEDYDGRRALEERDPLELPAYWNFWDWKDTTLRTDVDGRFEGPTTLLAWRTAAKASASKTGYEREREEVEGTFEPGERVHLDFRLEQKREEERQPTGTLVGSLRINGELCPDELSWKGPTRNGTAWSNAFGEFHIEQVEAGIVELKLEDPWGLELPGDELTRSIEVVEGVTTRCELDFTIAVKSIRGRVQYTDGSPASNFSMSARSDRSNGRRSSSGRLARGRTTVEEDGTYELWVRPEGGPYRVSIVGRSRATKDGIPAGAKGVDFLLEPMHRVRLRVLDGETNSKPAELTVGWRLPGEERYSYLTTRFGGIDFDPTGWFDLDVPDRSVDLWISANHEGYIPVFEPAFATGTLEAPTSLEVRLHRGLVVDFEAVVSREQLDGQSPDTWIVCIEEELADDIQIGLIDGSPGRQNQQGLWGGERFPGTTLRHRRLRFDGNGFARIHGLAPGSYVLRSFPPIPGLEPSRIELIEDPTEAIPVSW